MGYRGHGFPVLGLLLATAHLALPVAGENQGQRGILPGHESSIGGRVVDGETRRPISGAVVLVTNTPLGLQRRVTTVTDGTFAVEGLIAGSYAVAASRVGYLDGSYGRHSPIADQGLVEIVEGEHARGIEIRLWRFASLSGTVRDEAGDVLVGVKVVAFLRLSKAGESTLAEAGSALTDDRGAYRLGLMVPGRYALLVPSARSTFPPELNFAVTGRSSQVGGSFVEQSNGLPVAEINGEPAVFPTTYFPQALTLSDAVEVVVASGEDRRGADFVLRPVRPRTVSGTVLGRSGPAPFVFLRLVSRSAEDLTVQTGFESALTVSGEDGTFAFQGVTPGDYVVRALQVSRPLTPQSRLALLDFAFGLLQGPAGRRVPPSNLRLQSPPSEPELFIAQPVTVADEDVKLRLALTPAIRVGGHVAFVGSRPPPALTDLRLFVSLEPASGRVGDQLLPGWVDASGEFMTYGVPPGRYVIRVGGDSPGWFLRSAIYDGQDRVDSPMELAAGDLKDLVVTFTDRQGFLNGTVIGDGDVPDAAAAVLLFPVDRRAWRDFGGKSRRLVSARVSTKGRYQISAPPPGEYLIVAVAADRVDNWSDLKTLELLSKVATRIRIDDSQLLSQDLRTARPR